MYSLLRVARRGVKVFCFFDSFVVPPGLTFLDNPKPQDELVLYGGNWRLLRPSHGHGAWLSRSSVPHAYVLRSLVGGANGSSYAGCDVKLYACGIPRSWSVVSLPPVSPTRLLPPFLCRFYSKDDRHYRRAHPLPEDDDPSQQPQNEWSGLPLYITLAILAYLLTSTADPIPEISFPLFLQHMLYAGEVQRLEVNSSRDRVYVFLHPGALINGREVRRFSPQYMFTVSGVDSLEEKLRQAQDELGIPPSDRIPVNYQAVQSEVLPLVLTVLTTMLVAWLLFSFMFPRSSRKSSGSLTFNPFSYMSRARTTIITDPSQGSARFSDVAGMEEAKQEVMEFVDYLKTPEMYSNLGAKIPKGALLYGPPGTGKTLLARAIATEAEVPFLSIAGSDFVEMFAGVGSARVRDLFAQARQHAPCILYIDEIDAVGRSRRAGPAADGHHEQESTLNQLLVEMDGINPLEGVVILASTNRVDILDQALLRPGRFDRQIAIDLPTLAERKAIFEVYLKKIHLQKPVESYSSRLAALTPGHSGADIANIVNEAALHAAREKGEWVRAEDFEYAVERVIAGMEKKSSTLTPEERQVVAYHEAGHALTSWLLEHTDPVMKVSIIPRTRGILGFAQHLPSDQKLYTTEQLFDRMCMTLGGRAAEALTFRKITTGAQDDLERVTQMAYLQVVEYGMSPVIGHISLPLKRKEEIGRKLYSDKLSKMIDEEVREIVARAYGRTEGLLREHSEKLRKLAEALLEREVLNYSDIVELVGATPHEKKFHRYSELADLW